MEPIDTTAPQHTPKPGDFLEPDGWKFRGEKITADDGFKDNSFPGCQFRVNANPGYTNKGYDLAINLKVMGKTHFINFFPDRRKTRVKIEWVGDGEPSTFSGGWLYYDNE